MKKKILSLLLAVVMALSLVPTSVLAAPDDLGQVHVVVENTTFTEPVNGKAPAWTGTLVDSWVKLTEKSTMMSCVVKALEAKGYTQTGAESNYISEINGLAAFDGGGQSGWMGTLNDWFANEGFGTFTVAAGKLEGGDEIRIMYSRSYGDDLGGSFGSSDNTVKALSFSAGELSPAFGKDTHSYTLKLAADVSSVVVTPTASNKNFQVRTSVGGTEYKRTAEIPVADGTVITVKCGDPAWPSMNDKPEKAEEYTITVEQAAPAAVKVTVRSQAAGAYLHAPQEVEVSALDAEKYGFTDALEGVPPWTPWSRPMSWPSVMHLPRKQPGSIWLWAAAAGSPRFSARTPMPAASISTAAIPMTAPPHPMVAVTTAPWSPTPRCSAAMWWTSMS